MPSQRHSLQRNDELNTRDPHLLQTSIVGDEQVDTDVGCTRELDRIGRPNPLAA